MAHDAYLQIDGIKGASADSKHKDWIKVSNVDWHVHQPRALAISLSGHTAERAELSEISFKKIADLSSPVLQQTCAAGKTIFKARFEFMRPDGNGEPIKYYSVELENVMISSVAPSSGDGGLLTERVARVFKDRVELYAAEARRRRERQHLGRLGFGRQQDRGMTYGPSSTMAT